MHKSIKCAVVGDGFVGKSSLVQKFVNGKFDKTYIATLKDEYSAKVSTNGDVFSLNVSDIAGEHEDLSSIATSDIFIVCFSLVDDDSMDSVLNFWIPKIRAISKHSPIILAGTQSDLRQGGRHIPGSDSLYHGESIYFSDDCCHFYAGGTPWIP